MGKQRNRAQKGDHIFILSSHLLLSSSLDFIVCDTQCVLLQK